MIGTVRKHQQWLWIVIITVTILSFLVWNVNNRSALDARGGKTDGLGSINGKTITREQFELAKREVRILAFLTNRKWVDLNDMTRQEWIQEVYNRCILFEKLKELKAVPNDQAVVQWIKNLIGGGQQDIDFKAFQEVVKQTFLPNGVDLELFETFARHEMGREHLQAVYGVAGTLMTPGEAADLYKYENEMLNCQSVMFEPSNYLASATNPSPAAVEDFYGKHRAEYALPQRVQVAYIELAAANFLTEADVELPKMVTNMTEYVNQDFAMRTNDFKGMTLAQAEPKIKEDLRKNIGLIIAQRKANEFMEQLRAGHDDNKPLKLDDMTALATAKGYAVKESPLFHSDSTTNDVPFSEAAIETAFKLDDSNPDDKMRERLFAIPRAMRKDNAIYVLGLKKKVAREDQPLEVVRTKVTDDFKSTEALRLARTAGDKFGNAVTNEMAKGKTFSAVCEEFKHKPTELTPFSMNTRVSKDFTNMMDFQYVKNVAMKLTPGKASSFIATGDGGFVLYLASRSPVDTIKMQAELPKIMERIRDQRQYAAYMEWFHKQWSEMHVVAPLMPQPKDIKPKT